MVNEIEAKRAARRAAMPMTTSLVEFYAEFSPTVVYAHENGITVGKREQYSEVHSLTTDPRFARGAANV